MVYSISLLGSALLTASLARASPSGGVTKSELPFSIFDGITTPEEVSVKGGLDLPKLSPGVNGTSYDWWYFDAVSATDQKAVTLVFYNFANGSLAIPYFGGPLTTDISITFANGTTSRKYAAANLGAPLEVSNKGIAAEFKGENSSYSFTGTSLEPGAPNPVYNIEIDDPANGVSGSIKFESVSPPHYPCDLNKPGVSEFLLPNIWWANAIPDSNVVADLVIDGETFNLQGFGYHDKNWGVGSLEAATKTWYWGHGRVGPYSLVWFDATDKTGQEHFSSWVTKDGEVLSMSCADQATLVRPWGDNSDFPPAIGQAAPSGFNISFDMDDGTKFLANFTTETVQWDLGGFYKRLLGPISGGIEGGEQYEGRSLCEQFQF
ncbi:hypothetical protein KVR01_004101 [Diaporthe batatas]|uniref:uncharacterized protein n=1 Tax=Diaporthe batatas TaxID=748121 RepID=UPI001D056C27|nr:uncharacterized protein KVR01_004101 [Diaporthe batatas]KAG8165549.1 hypothetical protein KVR01_004101 [Diaporthe batatas]